jgi:(1->4)-alpha-D-glucan 1-alpha-D-glucosylmutase
VATVAFAVETAKDRRPDLDPDLFAFLGEVLLLRMPGDVETELALRFQQLTGPVMAKGAEDTAFYCYRRLVSLNEVGGDPGRFGRTVEELHQANRRAAEAWPTTLLTLSTHDTKRSGDVRARISLLSEIPDQWALAVRRWSTINEEHKRDGLPDRGAEYLLYQTLVGASPLPIDRAVAYLEKAAKEAKEHTSWIDPDPGYDDALRGFVEAALADERFGADLASFVAPLVEPGRVTSLAQTLLTFTSPGVPDLYQGTELWDLSLVDPDNRRPVDYDERRGLLAKVSQASAADALALSDEGAPKLWLVHRALEVRRSHAAAFAPGSGYEPLAAEGEKAAHVVAYARGTEAARVAVVLPRLVLGLGREWGDTTVALPEGRWTDVLGGAEVGGGPARVGELLSRFPVALLVAG